MYGREVEGPWGTMIQTSKTKDMIISFLKHLNRNPLGTTTTLVDLWLMCGALVTVASRPPSLTHATYTFVGIVVVVLLEVAGKTPILRNSVDAGNSAVEYVPRACLNAWLVCGRRVGWCDTCIESTTMYSSSLANTDVTLVAK